MLQSAILGWVMIFGAWFFASAALAGQVVDSGDTVVLTEAPACISQDDAVAVATLLQTDGFEAANAEFNRLHLEMDPASGKSRCAAFRGQATIGDWVAHFTDPDGDGWDVFEINFDGPPWKAYVMAPIRHKGSGQSL